MKLFDTFVELLTELLFEPAPTPPKDNSIPCIHSKPHPAYVEDRYGRRYQTVEQLEDERVAFRKSLERKDY
ncbi:MAG TPA: hypothetical protein VM103_01005 [Candidatus Paceibacterota bacterium]|nr:hypothetical protein [Candidatus Paceibacterota bacterium]